MKTKRILKSTKESLSTSSMKTTSINNNTNNNNNVDDNVNIVDDNVYITINVPVHMISVTCGTNFTIGIDNYGDLYSWGWNESGCLGQGKTCFSDDVDDDNNIDDNDDDDNNVHTYR